jgi:hypothetical protein
VVKTFGDFEFDERSEPEPRPANTTRYWSRALATYAAVAILVAIVVMLFVRTRYDKFVPSDRSRSSETVPAR